MFPLHDDNPASLVPYVTWTILIACILTFLWQLSHDSQAEQIIVHTLGVIPAVLFGHAILPPELVSVSAYATVFTSMFLHGGWMHLIGNVLYLWVFGNNIEAAMGHVRYALFYLICGVVAVLSQSLPDTASQVPMIGASGAISGVLGAYLLLYPQARVLVLIPVFFLVWTVRIPALYVLGVWFLMQLLNSVMSSGQEGGVAFGAHIGGFVAGMLLVPLFRQAGNRLYIPFVHCQPFRRWRGK
ncbi:rhomboid family intramembrane serine protease [Granulosicoccus sp. 3-233]|uniref:rhomboid family intramembrane serine protease n=1 Tax=Granulosicoccus sp. 3-233 TaxID=3417969 RepID=UPI003D35910B